MQADDATAAAWLDGMVEEMDQPFRSGTGLTLPGLGGFYLDRRRDRWAFKPETARALRLVVVVQGPAVALGGA